MPLLSATSLAGALGISIKSALAILDRLVQDGVAIEVTGRAARRLFGLRGLAPLAAAVAPPRRPQPGRGRGRPRRIPIEADPPAPPAGPIAPLHPVARAAGLCPAPRRRQPRPVRDDAARRQGRGSAIRRRRRWRTCALSEILRRLHGGEVHQLIDLDLLSLDHRVVCMHRHDFSAFNPGFAAAR